MGADSLRKVRGLEVLHGVKPCYPAFDAYPNQDPIL